MSRTGRVYRACTLLLVMLASGLWGGTPVAGSDIAITSVQMPRGDSVWLQRQLDAQAGAAVIDVPAGEYLGAFVVARPLHLRGHGQVRLRGDGQTHVVAIVSAGVTLEGFEIAGSGLDLSRDHAAVHVTGAHAIIRDNTIVDSLHGVYVRGVDGVRIEGNDIVGKATTVERVDPDTLQPTPTGGETCEVGLNQNRRGNGIHIWNSSGHLIEGNRIRDTRDGIYFSFVTRSVIRGNTIAGARYGLHYMYSDDNQFAQNRFVRSAAGAALMFSDGLVLSDNRFEGNRNQRAYGLLLQTIERSEIGNNRITGNTLGLFLEGGSNNRVRGNVIAGNHVGVRVSDSSDGNVFSGNSFVGNLHTVETEGRNRFNAWTQEGRGNYWDGALRLDLNRDDVSDVPHRELDVFGRLRREVPQVSLLMGSPGERLLRFVHARAAILAMPGVKDHRPLMKEPHR